MTALVDIFLDIDWLYLVNILLVRDSLQMPMAADKLNCKAITVISRVQVSLDPSRLIEISVVVPFDDLSSTHPHVVNEVPSFL